MAPPRIDPALRFFARVRKLRNGCWQWTGGSTLCNRAINEWRYGMFRPGGRAANVFAHRWSYETHKGKIPRGKVVDHLCRNTLCVNPDHLEVVTLRENLRRGFNANAAKTHCIRGHKFTLENTRIGKRGNRICRKCKALHANAAYQGVKLCKVNIG